MIELAIDDSVRERWSGEAVLVMFSMQGLSNNEATRGVLDEEIISMESELRKIDQDIFSDQQILRMRKTFRSMPDMDPARYRPASEALIRRSLSKGLFRIGPLVDVNNLLSIRLRFPLGIYNLERVYSTVWTYRIGGPGETYFTISQQQKNADGKLVIADSEGVIGSPVADSKRAAIDQGADKIMVLGYIPSDSSKSEAEMWTREIRNTFERFFSPKSSNSTIIFR